MPLIFLYLNQRNLNLYEVFNPKYFSFSRSSCPKLTKVLHKNCFIIITHRKIHIQHDTINSKYCHLIFPQYFVNIIKSYSCFSWNSPAGPLSAKSSHWYPTYQLSSVIIGCTLDIDTLTPITDCRLQIAGGGPLSCSHLSFFHLPIPPPPHPHLLPLSPSVMSQLFPAGRAL